MRAAIVCITYKRANLLQSCLSSLEAARDFHEFDLYVVQQGDFKDVSTVIAKHANSIKTHIKVKADEGEVERNINFNRIVGFEFAFDAGHNFVLGVEEDVEITSDSLSFILEVLRHEYSSKFKGINLGSMEDPQAGLEDSYSLLRYGIHGPAGGVTKSTWEKAKMNLCLEGEGIVPWDSWLEPHLKTGFMVTPNISRYKDNGIGGTHTSADSNSNYFKKLREGFDHIQSSPADTFKRIEIKHNWREDCKNFDYKDQLYSIIYRYLVHKIHMNRLKFKSRIMGNKIWN